MGEKNHLVLREAPREAYVSREDGLHLCALREDAREADFVASSDTIDRHGEVVDQNSWLLEEFKKNPIVLYGHNSWDLPIGQATRVEVVNGKLECTIRFASKEANPEAEKVWLLVKEKVLRAVSVGFRPEEGRYEIRDGEEVFVFYKNRLREISVVALPANPDALAKMLDQMKSDARAKAAPTTNNGAANAAQPTAPIDGEKDQHMDLKEALAKIDQLNVTLGETKTAAQTANEKLVAAEKRSETSEARVKTLETEKATVETKLVDLDGAFSKISKALEDSGVTFDPKAPRVDQAVKSVQSLIATNTELNAKNIEAEVDALIGVKLAPAEKEEFVTLRKTNPDLFAKMIEKRQPMKLGERITTPDSKAKDGTPPPAAEPVTDVWNSL